MKKIKILMAIRQGKIGGGETHVLQLAAGLDRTVYEPVVLSFTDGEMVTKLRSLNITTHVLHTESPFDVRIWSKVSQLMQIEGINMVHAHGTRAMSNVFFAARSLNLPLFYTVHGWSFHPDQKPWLRKLRLRTEAYLTRKAHRTICVSKSNQQDGKQFFGMNNSQVIYNAVDVDQFSAQRTNLKDVRQELGIAPHKTVIGYIVRMTHQKDPFTMLRAMKMVGHVNPNAVLLMVGDGELKQQAIDLATELGIQGQVVFSPFRTDIPDVLAAVDIYCLPSLWEGFPIGILEAMAMGKLVVASPVDGTKELVQDGRTGLLVANGSPRKLADALNFFIDSPTLRQEIADKGQVYVRKYHNISKLVDQVSAVYQEFVPSNRSAYSRKFAAPQATRPSLGTR